MDNETLKAMKQVHSVGGHFSLNCGFMGEQHGWFCTCWFHPAQHFANEKMKEIKEDEPDVVISSMRDLFSHIANHRPTPTKEELESTELTHEIKIECFDAEPQHAVERATESFLAAYSASVTARATQGS